MEAVTLSWKLGILNRQRRRPTFWSAFAASGYSYAGAATAFTQLLDIQKDDQIYGTGGDDRIRRYDAGGILLGHSGNDTFVVNDGVFGGVIYGTVLDGSGADVDIA